MRVGRGTATITKAYHWIWLLNNAVHCIGLWDVECCFHDAFFMGNQHAKWHTCNAQEEWAPKSTCITSNLRTSGIQIAKLDESPNSEMDKCRCCCVRTEHAQGRHWPRSPDATVQRHCWEGA